MALAAQRGHERYLEGPGYCKVERMQFTGPDQSRTAFADPGDTFVQALARGLAVFRAFTPQRSRLTMAQVATSAQLTRAGARRILVTLQRLGYVAMEGRYFYLTSRVLNLRRGYLLHSLWELMRPELRTLANELNETVSAGILDGFDVVYTVRHRVPRLLQLELAPGAHLPAHASAMGQVLLAELSPVELGSYLRQATFERLTPRTIADRETLLARLEEVRARGWCLVLDGIEEGTSGVAVPLRDKEGKALAALMVGLITDYATPDYVEGTVLPKLRRTAATITAML